jgi:hypothetical protein
VRLAGRDLARHGVRIAAATAAVAVTLAGSVAVATYFDRTAAEVERSRAEGTMNGQPESLAGGAQEMGELVPRLSRLVDGRVQPLVAGADTVATLRSTGASVGTLAPIPTGAVVESGLRYCNGLGGPPEFECSPATAVVADDAMVAMLPDRVAASLRQGRAVLSSGIGRLEDRSGAAVPSDAVQLQLTTPDGTYAGSSALSDTLLDRELADRLGLDPTAATNPSVVVDLDDVDVEQRRELVEMADGLGFDLRVQTWNAASPEPVSNTVLRTGAVAVVSLVVLLIVMITLALVRVESRSDDEVLLVAGASPGTSRRVSAARAGLIVVAAAIPASLAGWWVARSLMSGAVGVPWWAIGVGVLVLPPVAASIAALTHRPPRRLQLG